MVGRGLQKIKGKETMCIHFRHNNFPNKILYCCPRWGRHVVSEGDPQQIFEHTPEAPAQVDEAIVEEPGEDGNPIPEHVFHLGANAEDIAHIRGLGFTVDDDNEPVPENIPDGTTQDQPSQEETWGWDGIDEREKGNFIKHMPHLLHGLDEIPTHPSNRTILHLFLSLFPKQYLQEDILMATNKNLDVGEMKISFGELLRFLGIWFFLATTAGFPRRDYFSTFPVNNKSGAPYRVGQWMSRNRFEQILRALSFTSRDPPNFKDRFWQVRDVINAWNINMHGKFKSGWVTCLDESMSSWLSKYTCPGWMFVPRKPRPFGNEYHSICCGVSGIMFAIELVEGKDRPPELPSPPKDEKTKHLLLSLCQSLYSSGKIVVLDSGFSVMKALVALKKVGVFAHAVAKKRRFWPKCVPGDKIEKHMESKQIGEVDCLNGELDGEKYKVFVMKEPDYTMKLMSTYGGLTVCPGERETERYADGKKHSFKYTTNFSYHFKYRHMVDDHNNLRHSNPSFEDTWVTKNWPCRVFAFLLAITEVNVYLYLRWKNWRLLDDSDFPTLHQFRKQLAFALIDNHFLIRDEADRRVMRSSTSQKHFLQRCPPYAKKFERGIWDLGAASMYQQHRCRGKSCRKMIRTFCACSPGTWMCSECFPKHICEALTTDESSC